MDPQDMGSQPGCWGLGLTLQVSLPCTQENGPECSLVSGSLPGTSDPSGASSDFASLCSLGLGGGCPGVLALSHNLARLFSGPSRGPGGPPQPED